ncbi:MAG: hypothetical protein ACO3GP_02835 [Candidatus Limnocylindrus sp.]
MTPTQTEIVAVVLFAASEVVGLSPLRSNSLLQLALQLLTQAFPFRRKG